MSYLKLPVSLINFCLISLVFSCSQRMRPSDVPTSKDLQTHLTSASRSLESLTNLPVKSQQAIVYRWAKKYQEEGEKQKACQLFHWLDQKGDFFSSHHLLIGKLSTCPYSQAQVMQQTQQLVESSTNHWAKEDVLRASDLILTSISENKKNNLHAQVLLELHEFEPNQEAKIKTLQLAQAKASTQETQEQIQAALEEVAPRFIEKPSFEKYFDVARDLERARDFTKAREYYQKILKSSQTEFEQKLKSFERIGLSYKVQRSREAYLKELSVIEKQIQNIKTSSAQDLELKNRYLVDHQITRARAIWTANDREAGKMILERSFASGLANNDQKAQILFVLGAMEIEKNRPEQAQKLFKEGLQFETTDKKIAELLSWSLGWSYYLDQKYPEAIASFEEAALRVDNVSFISKVKFWQAQSYLKMNNQSRAHQIFRQIIKEEPIGYYAFLSHHLTKTPFQPFSQKIESRSIDPLFEWLVLIDEKKSAKARLESLLEQKALDHVAIIQAYYRGEMYREAIFHYGRNQESFSLKEQMKLLPYIFPLEHLDSYRHFSDLYQLPLELSLSITRQESAFDPDARSWADAFGLMQLIPERANQLAKELRLEINHFSDLYDPALNIQLGSYLLAKLLRQYNSQYPFNIAAYNAGERPVNNWKKHRYQGDILEFVESIPYQETQNYVKLILRNKVIYKKLLSDKSFSLEDVGITSF